MSLATNNKILLGTTLKTIEYVPLKGDGYHYNSLTYANALVKSIEFANMQIDCGNESYKPKLKVLNEKLQQLKYKCTEVCLYKDHWIPQNKVTYNEF